MPNLPIHLFNFWYSNGFKVLLRVWRNSLLVLEEDLAVGLMFKLLFVPLFHDSSLVGRGLSFLFRLSRIGIGLFAFFIISAVIFILSVLWFSTPILLLISLFSLFIHLPYFGPLVVSLLFYIFILGLALFIYHEFYHGLIPLWDIKSFEDLWRTTKLKKLDVTWDKLLQSSEVALILENLEITAGQFSSQNIPVDSTVLEKVWQLGKANEAQYITEGYFFISLLSKVPNVTRELIKINLKLEDFAGALKYLELKRNLWRKIFVWDEDFAVHHLKGVNRGWLGAPTPALDAISQDLTKLASTETFPKFEGRQAVLSEVITVLSQTKDRNVVLVGANGSGKSTLVNHLASLILAGDAPDALATKRLVKFEITKLLSDVQTEGDLAKKIKDAFDEAQFLGNTIIYIPEIHNLGIGDAGKNFNLLSLLIPYIESASFQFLSSTEEDYFESIIEKNGNFLSLFHKIEVPPASIEDTITILSDRSIDLLKANKIHVSYLAIKTMVELSAKLVHDRVLPDSALSLMEESEVKAENSWITSKVVKEVLEKRINMPLKELDSENKKLLLNLEEEIHKNMIDQVEAVKKVSDTLRRSSTDLREQNRPIGSFLFVGPTGVGKTELAKTLAEIYFKNKTAFLRFDMSEYQSTESINRLLGTQDHPGELTEAVKNRPYSLLLLDEFEKADPKILNLFLQVLDDGRLTDFSHQTVDFTNTIIIATSNAASITIAEGLTLGKTLGELDAQVRNELLKVYKPELLNRFDAVVMFKTLSQEDLEKIVNIKLLDLKNMLSNQGYFVEFTPALVSQLAQKGFDPSMGARPLRRLIQDTLEARISRLILEDKIQKGENFKADIDLLS